MKLADLKQFNLPDTSGVYFFKSGKKILYIGKATSLKDRVKSYFARDILMTRSLLIAKMLEKAEEIKFVQTDSVLEALILEANEIKKYQPIYNSKEKDDKSHNFVVITKEEFPRVLLRRGREFTKVSPWYSFGPFPHGGELKEALKIIRKIFPYRDDKCKIYPAKAGRAGKPCFNAQIGLCPGVCAGWISKKDYRQIVRHLRLFFEAKKPQLIKSLEKEMKSLAKEHRFEEAEKIKRQIFALEHIQDIALIKEEVGSREKEAGFRIEAYDIAHLSGTNVVGVMTVIEGEELNKSQYRKFKLRHDQNDDLANLKETLTRRFAHSEWRFPDLIVVDGGKGQINVAEEILRKADLNIDVVSVVKDERHKAREILEAQDQTLSINAQGLTFKKLILLANSEAHRFAISYHRRLRGKGFRI